jgi:hypothetical protein
MSKFPKVSIVSINYNQPQVTAEMIKSLQQITYPNTEIIIVDNGSPEHTCKEIEHEFTGVKFIYLEKNLGFAGGNNEGFKHATGKYILMLNNDTEVDKDFLQPLVEQMENNPKIGIISPKIYYYHHDNLIQYAGTSKINHITSRGRHFGNKEQDNGQYNTASETYYPHGAAMLFRKSLLDEIGLMYDGYFLYYEEYDFAERVKKQGYSIWFEPKSKIYHKESVSTGKNSPLKTYYMTRNRLLFLRRNVSGITFLLAILYFFALAYPKNFIKHLIKGEFKHTAAIINGIKWHLKNNNNNIHKNKTLFSQQDFNAVQSQ